MSDMTIQNAIHCMKAIICEAVCEECDYYGKTGTDHCEADAVRMAIKALEAQPHWIPCSERLPRKEENKYWVCTDAETQHACRWTNNIYGIRESDNWGWCVFDIPQYTKVTAWMPLPKPYGGESDV